MPRQPLGTVIFQKGLLSAEQLLEALEEGHRSHRRLGDVLLERGWLDERALAEMLAEQYGLPVVDLEPGDVNPEAARSMSAHDSGRLGAIVTRFEDGAPVVAVSDPSNAAALAELELMLGPAAGFAVAAPSRIEDALRSVFGAGEEREESARAAEAPATEEVAEPAQFAPFDVASAPADEPASPPELDAEPMIGWDAPESAPEAAEDAESEADAPPAEQAPEWPPAAEVAFESDHDAAEPLAASFATENVAEPEPASADGFDELQRPAEAEQQSDDDLSWAFGAASEPTPAHFGLHEPTSWPQALATQEHVVTPEEAELNGHAGGAAAPSVVVLRLAGGGAVEVGSFAERQGASTKAAELVAQLIADESSSWTEIDGNYFRPQGIVAVEVVPAAG